MYLEKVSIALDSLYATRDYRDSTVIRPHLFFEGDGMTFLFHLESEKYAQIRLSPNFAEWMAWCTDSWKKAAPKITQLAEPYGVQWDNEEGLLFIRFRRNEMTVSEAVLRLHQAALVVGSLGHIVK